MAVAADYLARQRQAVDPAVTVWVSASAGTGKTKVLTDRVLGLLLQGTAPGRILCLTFTRAAAAQMQTRIAQKLGAWATAEDAEVDRDLADLLGAAPDEVRRGRARRLFAQVIDAPVGLRISTIHAFCESLLKRFPLEAGIAPHFAVLDERSTAVALADYGAVIDPSNVTLRWTTVNESAISGFAVYRSDSSGVSVYIASLSAQKPGQADGASYSLTDNSAVYGVSYTYLLEVQMFSGGKETMTLANTSFLWLPMAVR